MKRISLEQKLQFITSRGILKQISSDEEMERINKNFDNPDCSAFNDEDIKEEEITKARNYQAKGFTFWEYSTTDNKFPFSKVLQHTKNPKTFIELIYVAYEK